MLPNNKQSAIFSDASWNLTGNLPRISKKLNESSTISYEDEAGYWVTRPPEGVVTGIGHIRQNA